MLLEILECDDLPHSLHISNKPYKENEVSGLYTFHLKTFPRERVGFTVEFWVKFPFIASSTVLFEFVDKTKSIFTCKYMVEPIVTEVKKDEDDSFRSSTKGGAMVHYFQFEGEGLDKRAELEIPLLQADHLTHIVVHYSKISHTLYIDGKIVYSSQGTQNPYPMTFAKNIHFRLSSQSKVISPVTIYEGGIDNSLVKNLYFRGPLDEYINTEKKLGIDLPKIYKFPKALKESLKLYDTEFEKLVIAQPDVKLEEHKKLENKNFSFTITTTEAHPQYLKNLFYLPDSEYQTLNTKAIKPHIQLYDSVGSASALLIHTFTLKQFLSSSQLLKLLLNQLSHCKEYELPILLKIFELLCIHNEEFISSIKDINIPSFFVVLYQYWTKALPENINVQQCIMGTLLDLYFSYKDTITNFNVFSKPNLLLIPILNRSRLKYSKSIQNFLMILPQTQKEAALNTLSVLLYSQENMEILSEGGLQFIITYLLKEVSERSGNPDNFLYEKLLEIFQLYFYWHHTLDWELLYSFFLLLKEKGTVDSQNVLVDILSMLSIYIYISNNRVALAEKFSSTNGLKVYFY